MVAGPVSEAVRAYVALGSNLGDRMHNLTAALAALDAEEGVRVVAVSGAYESKPWGGVEQPDYANAVAELRVSVGAATLLAACKRIERRLGRAPSVRYGPRAIDIDVLIVGDESVSTPELTVPHPRLLERDFVVTPLLEIAPGITLPDGTPVCAESATSGRVTGVLGRIPLPGDAPDRT